MSKTKHRLHRIISKLNFRRTLALIWSLAPVWSTVTVFFILLENALWISTILTLKNLIDQVSKINGSGQGIVFYIVLAGLASILYVSIKSITGFLHEAQATRVNHLIDKKIHTHTLSLDYECYENPEYLDVLKRAKEAGVDRPSAVVASLIDLAKNGMMLASVSYILISIDWILLPLLAIFILPILLIRIKFSDKVFHWQKRNTGVERQTGYLSYLICGENAAKEIRVFSLGAYLQEKYSVIKERLMKQQLQFSKQRTIIELATTILATSAFYALTTYIIFKTINTHANIGNIAVFLVVFPQSFSIMQNMVGAITRLYQNNIYVSNIFELFDIQPSIEKRNRSQLSLIGDTSSGISIDRLFFKYPHSTDTVLEDISITIPAGKIIALVGLNGAGKSTLIKLLCRLYDPVNGKICFGENNITEFDIADYRKQISVVFQDFVKYNVSVADNIWFGDINAKKKDNEISEAAINAGAHSFIETFPKQYDTILGRVFDEGHEISVGQWQKLAIARAFYSHSRLVILDEATSALDAISESALFKSFRQRIGSRSALVISHRLSTIKQADYIYVMANKKIAEKGTHQELIDMNGKYAAIFKSSAN